IVFQERNSNEQYFLEHPGERKAGNNRRDRTGSVGAPPQNTERKHNRKRRRNVKEHILYFFEKRFVRVAGVRNRHPDAGEQDYDPTPAANPHLLGFRDIWMDGALVEIDG